MYIEFWIPVIVLQCLVATGWVLMLGGLAGLGVFVWDTWFRDNPYRIGKG